MTVLEEKIRKNREQYDVREPDEGHVERFSEMLDAEFHHGQGRKPGVFYILRYAASILIVAAVAAVLLFQYSDNSSVANANTMDDELSKVIDHYNRLTDQKLAELSNCSESEEESTKLTQIAGQQLQNLENDADVLKEELKKDASNDRVYGALVNNYRTRIKILDNIITKVCQL